MYKYYSSIKSIQTMNNSDPFKHNHLVYWHNNDCGIIYQISTKHSVGFMFKVKLLIFFLFFIFLSRPAFLTRVFSVWFVEIFISHLTPKSTGQYRFKCQTVLFQIIQCSIKVQFRCQKQFYFEQFSSALVRSSNVKTVLF